MAITAPSQTELSSSYALDVARGRASGMSIVNKFGRIPTLDAADGFATVWNGTKGLYLGFDAVAGEAITVSSGSAADAGTTLTTGSTLTGGSATTAIDTTADFVTDTVAAGDIIINDTQGDHAIVVTVTSLTTLTFTRWRYGTVPAATDSYRVVTPASTGAAVVRLQRILDTSGALYNEYVVLNGATGVDTTGGSSAYFRCSRARVVLAGSGGTNAGIITAKQKTTTANIFIMMPVGYNSTMVCADTVPAGKEAYLVSWGLSMIAAGAYDIVGRISTRPTGEVFQVQEEIAIRGGGSSLGTRRYDLPKGPYPALTDIRLDVDTDTDASAVSAHFSLIFVDV